MVDGVLDCLVDDGLLAVLIGLTTGLIALMMECVLSTKDRFSNCANDSLHG